MSGPLRLAVVTASDTAGGAEAHTVALATGLRARGHDVVLHGRCPGWEAAGLPREPLALGPKWSRRTLVGGLLRVPVERRRVRGLAPPSVFHLQFKREQVALTSVLARKAPVVWTEHGRWLGGVTGRVLLRAYARAARDVSRLVCVSEDVAADLRDVVDPGRVVVVPNAVDTSRYAPPSAQRRADLRRRLLPEHFQDRTVAVLASRLHPAKRHERAIAAASAGGCALLVLGAGPDRPRLESLAGGSGDVWFTGHREDVADLLAACDLYLYSGARAGEGGTPLAVLEAAACGLPVVAFAGEPGSDLVSRCGGLVMGDPAELTPDRLEPLLRARGRGVAYVARLHGRDGWLDAYEGVFREAVAG